MKLVFDEKLLQHINESAIKERGSASKTMVLIQTLLSNSILKNLLGSFEWVASLLLNLPIPIYSSLIYTWVTHSRGLPHMGGMYLRALYYRRKLGYMESNVFIDQNIFIAYPKAVELKEFCYLDKDLKIMSKTTKIGRRVHIAARAFIGGGGDFEIEDYAGMAPNVCIITSTEVLKDGARCSGPMVSVEQRSVIRGKVLIKKDAFVGVNATLLPNVTMGVGSVAAAGTTLKKDTEPWGIYAGERAKKVAMREPVRWGDN